MGKPFDPKEYLKEEEKHFDPQEYLNKSIKEDQISMMPDKSGLVTLGEGLMKGIDYVPGLARESIAYAVDKALGRDTNGSFAERMAAAGAGEPISSQEFVEKLGVPEKVGRGPISIPASTIAGVGLDVATGEAEARALKGALNTGSKVVRSLLGSDTAGVRAVGSSKPEVEALIETAPRGDRYENVRKLSKYAVDSGVIKPFSGTEKMLNNVGKRLEDVGSQIGSIRRKNEALVDQYLVNNVGGVAQEYFDRTFIPNNVKDRIFKAIDMDVKEVTDANKIKNIVGERLDDLQAKYNGAVPVDDLSKIKASWQNAIGYGQGEWGHNIRKDAIDYLRRAANDSIQNEIDLADKVYKGSDKELHRSLNTEYSNLIKMENSLLSKGAKETANPDILKAIDPRQMPRLQSLIANIPEAPVGNKSMWAMRGIGAAGEVAAMQPGGFKEQRIADYPVSMTTSIAEYAQKAGLITPEMQNAPGGQEIMMKKLDMVKAEQLNNIMKDENMSNIEKSQRRKLLEKHGRIYIGQ